MLLGKWEHKNSQRHSHIAYLKQKNIDYNRHFPIFMIIR